MEHPSEASEVLELQMDSNDREAAFAETADWSGSDEDKDEEGEVTEEREVVELGTTRQNQGSPPPAPQLGQPAPTTIPSAAFSEKEAFYAFFLTTRRRKATQTTSSSVLRVSKERERARARDGTTWIATS